MKKKIVQLSESNNRLVCEVAQVIAKLPLDERNMLSGQLVDRIAFLSRNYENSTSWADSVEQIQFIGIDAQERLKRLLAAGAVSPSTTGADRCRIKS